MRKKEPDARLASIFFKCNDGVSVLQLTAANRITQGKLVAGLEEISKAEYAVA